MPYNIPTYATNRFSFGPGVLYIGSVGTTPTVDVGGVRSGGSLALSREVLEVPQGSPRTIVQRWATAEMATLSVTGIEWNIQRLSQFLGVDYSAGPPNSLALGGDMNIDQVSLKFVHQTPAGGTVEILFWSSQGSGDIEVTFGDEVHEFPYVFNAVRQTSDWGSVALSDGAQLCKVQYWPPP